jgi:hypothetical protein
MPSGPELNGEFNFWATAIVDMLTHTIMMNMSGSCNVYESVNIK